MRRFQPILIATALTSIALAADFELKVSKEELNEARVKLLPLHQKLGKPKRGEWLAEHEERGQTFDQYLKSDTIKPWGLRNTIYIQPIGEFSTEQQQVLDETVSFMKIFFGRDVIVQPALRLELIPAKARRIHPQWGDEQILTSYVLYEVLNDLPANAAVGLAFTASDLWPGEGWNFVFGQASLRSRVGVWSIYRNGDPAMGDAAYQLCLRRTIKTAIHETAHMFTMLHCIAYECGMCGSNHRTESDQRPIYFCPECDMKICWATQQKPLERYEKLLKFCRDHGLKAEAEMYARSIETLKK
ncbi:archaemetzincin [Pontiellaceae bacterium B1224]|nr:archaemetzincin [Pontiellaceae bacterium B1224]